MSVRILHIDYCQDQDCIVAADTQGRLHTFDRSLNLLAQSAQEKDRAPLYIIKYHDGYIYARDINACLYQFKVHNLQLEKMILTQEFIPEDISPIPTVSHGLKIWNNKIYIVDGMGCMRIYSHPELKYLGVVETPFEGFFEDIETSKEKHFAVDCAGYLYQGHLEAGKWEICQRIDHGATHRIVRDIVWNRFWITADAHTGVALVSMEGKVLRRLCFTNDDVEWLAFNKDYTHVYIACFDHYLYVFKNSETPELVHKIGPFKFQLKQVIYLDEEHIYVLLESGEVFQVHSDGRILNQSPTGTDCIWDIKPSVGDKDIYYLALESGIVAKARITRESIQVLQRSPYLKMGRIRRLVVLNAQEFIVATSQGYVAKVNFSGDVLWSYSASGIVRDLAECRKRDVVIFVSEKGEVTCLNRFTGFLLWSKRVERPAWAVAVDDEDYFYVGERAQNVGDDRSESTPSVAHLYKGKIQDGQFIGATSFLGNIKRIQFLPGSRLLINGNGDIATRRLCAKTLATEQVWAEWQLNTCEDAKFLNDKLVTITYGYQLNKYSENGNIESSDLCFSDYPKSLLTLSDSEVLVCGRGPFVKVIKLGQEGLEVQKTLESFI